MRRTGPKVWASLVVGIALLSGIALAIPLFGHVISAPWAAPSATGLTKTEAVAIARGAVAPSAVLVDATSTTLGASGATASGIPKARAVWVVEFRSTMPYCPPLPEPQATVPPCSISPADVSVIVDAVTRTIVEVLAHGA